MKPLNRSQFLKAVGLGALSPSLWTGRASASPAMQDARAATKSLKIKDVEIYLNDIKLVAPFTVALGTIDSTNGVLIRIVTDTGIVGIGESSPFQPVTGDTQQTNIAVAQDLRTMLKGKDPLAIESANKLFGAYYHSNSSIVAAFDMALYDILGKAAGLPIFRLLGGDKTTFETDLTVGIDTPEKMAVEAKGNAAKGFRIHKIKVGQDPDTDVERLQAVRDALGNGHAIRIDANQGYTVPQAIYALRRMEKFKIEFCEQPVLYSDIAGLKKVRDASPMAIMADEALFLPVDALELIKAEACDYFNIKLMKSGGISSALRIAAIAEAANIRCMLGCMAETRIALTAAAHVHGAQKNIVFADLDGYFSHAVDPVIDGMTVRNGIVTLPEKPGLGADVDPAFLKTLKKC